MTRAEPPTPRSRPYRLSIDGGHVVATFAYADRARQRGREIVDHGLARRCWLRHRDEQNFEVIRRTRR